MTPAPRLLSARSWLALALLVVFCVPLLATAVALGTQWRDVWATRADAEALLRAGADRWGDPAWREATRTTLAGRGVDFVLSRMAASCIVARSARPTAARRAFSAS